MREPQIQSESERALERLVRERKGAEPKVWANEAQTAFEEFLRGRHRSDGAVFQYMKLLGPEVAAPVVARVWKGLDKDSQVRFLERWRSPKEDLRTYACLAEQFVKEGEATEARRFLGILTTRLGRLDQPELLKQAELFANAGGLDRAARTTRLAFDAPESIERSLGALVDVAERLIAAGWKKPQKHLGRLVDALAGALDEQHPGLDTADALVQRTAKLTALASRPADGQPSRTTSAGRRTSDGTGSAAHSAHGEAAAGRGAAEGATTPMEPDSSAASSRKALVPPEPTGERDGNRQAGSVREESESGGPGTALFRDLKAWAESVERRLSASLDGMDLAGQVSRLEVRLSTLERTVERERAAADAKLSSTQAALGDAVAERDSAIAMQESLKAELSEKAQVFQTQRREAFEERDRAVEHGLALQQEVQQQRAALEEEQRALDRAVTELPRQRVEEFKRRLEGKLHPILSELEQPTDGVEPLHHLDVLLDRWRALRDVLRKEGVLSA